MEEANISMAYVLEKDPNAKIITDLSLQQQQHGMENQEQYREPKPEYQEREPQYQEQQRPEYTKEMQYEDNRRYNREQSAKHRGFIPKPEYDTTFSIKPFNIDPISPKPAGRTLSATPFRKEPFTHNPVGKKRRYPTEDEI